MKPIDDRRWFKRHRDRSLRLRPLFPGEWLPVGEGFVAPPGWEVWAIVKQLEPGMRTKHSVCVDPVIAADAIGSEELTRAMFELLVTNPRGSGPVSTREVVAVAEGYFEKRVLN